ncbi:YdcF family protein [Pseudarthrobacter sp. PS3-L1]|uniref:YdcF family protein n=1 Tax=Pseudarthrobacter sp. PS3-L1 TaxID=3046207 RepID=UPI0024BA5B9E|nr:YdcF family protein [Pseudarthrobacter sp. PS3-L1]MDJ0321750.1 YdcF family protein [Pseudarthrobacter sp. PS3-L1]
MQTQRERLNGVHLSPRAVQTALKRAFIVALCGFALWLLLAVQLFVNVEPLAVDRTDAVIMLGGDSEERLPAARALQAEFDVPVLVLATTGLKGNVSADSVCGSLQRPDDDLLCFRPAPRNTRGEALAISRMIELNGWRSVSVVTSNYHVTRAGRLIRQCTTAEVQMVPAPASMGPGDWLWRFVVETGGLLDASMRPECDGPRR